jgi:membrane-bound lytic murein transglycosylase D
MLGRSVRGLGLASFIALAALASPAASAGDSKGTTSSHAGTKSGSKPARPVDAATRRWIAGGPTADDTWTGVESPELKSLRDAERELFPPAAPAPGGAWPSNLAVSSDRRPVVDATGVPPARSLPASASDAPQNLTWLEHLEMPDLPVRWDERVVRYLQYFRDEPRGHTTFANLYRHSGRWRDMMRRALRRKGLPEDLIWVSMIESGFDPAAHSMAGAQGLWQLMPETARIYGLAIDRWLDQRLNAPVATDAAADLLADLHRRFGTWELALAGFNMGYGGLVSIVKRYNTNDFWALERTEGALPWETSLYVPKVFAAAVVAHNLAAFGFGDLVVDPPVETDEVNVPPGTPLSLVAQAASCTTKELEALNPDLRAARTPPAGDADAAAVVAVNVPAGKGASATQALLRIRRDQPSLDRYVVRFGETLEQIAAAHKTTPQRLVDLNAIAPGEAVRGGTTLLVPHTSGTAAAAEASLSDARDSNGLKPPVVVPSDMFAYPDKKRVFYRVLVGDTLGQIASALHVAPDDLARWNDMDAGARLQEGMTLQAFVPQDADLSRVVTVPENDVRVLAVGSEEFFTNLERDKQMRRVTVVAKDGDTLASIGRRYDISPSTMERVNRKGRRSTLKAGDTVVLYVPNATTAPAGNGAVTALSASDPVPNGPLPLPPVPDLLP